MKLMLSVLLITCQLTEVLSMESGTRESERVARFAYPYLASNVFSSGPTQTVTDMNVPTTTSPNLQGVSTNTLSNCCYGGIVPGYLNSCVRQNLANNSTQSVTLQEANKPLLQNSWGWQGPIPGYAATLLSSLNPSPKPNRGKPSHVAFTPEEDSRLLMCIKTHNENWKFVAADMNKAFPNRGRRFTTKTCKDRYKNYLSPDIVACSWTKDENDILWTYYEKWGAQWAAIAEILGNKTGDQVKRQFNYLKRSQTFAGFPQHSVVFQQNRNEFNSSQNAPSPVVLQNDSSASQLSVPTLDNTNSDGSSQVSMLMIKDEEILNGLLDSYPKNSCWDSLWF